MRYDRQIRIWEASGQSKIEKSSILCIGNGHLMWEVLKNLILGGFGTLYVSKSQWIIEKQEQLKKFNPSITLQIVDSFENLNVDLVLYLNNIDYTTSINAPSITAYNNGWYGFITIAHSGYIAQKREKHVDLMLYAPFPTLKAYLQQDLKSLTDYDYAHTPFPVFLSQLDATSKNRKELKNKLKCYIKSNVDMDNIQEAMDYVYYAYTKPNYPDVMDLFQKAHRSTEWTIINAIHQFYKLHDRLPISLDIPDLKATTTGYLEFKKLYSTQFEVDCLEIQSISNCDLESVIAITKVIRDLIWVEPTTIPYLNSIHFPNHFNVMEHGHLLYSYLQQHLHYRSTTNSYPSTLKDINCTGTIEGYHKFI